MKLKRVFLAIIPLLISCAQPLSPEQYVRQFSTSFEENASIRFGSLLESMMELKLEFGSKFLLVFFIDNCSACINLYPAFQELGTHGDKYFDESTYSSFKFYSHFVNEDTYSELVLRENLHDFITLAVNDSVRIIGIGDNLVTAFPAIILFDINPPSNRIPGIQAFWLGVPGATTEIKATRLASLWNYSNLING